MASYDEEDSMETRDTEEHVAAMRRRLEHEYSGLKIVFDKQRERVECSVIIQQFWRRLLIRRQTVLQISALREVIVTTIRKLHWYLSIINESESLTMLALSRMSDTHQRKLLLNINPNPDNFENCINLLKLIKENNVSAKDGNRVEQGRLALVISNGDAETRTRIEAFIKMLKECDFYVLHAHNPSLKELREVTEAFAAVCKPGLILMVLYHGVLLEGCNASDVYALPHGVCKEEVTPDNILYECFPINGIFLDLNLCNKAQPIVILSADTTRTVVTPRIPDGIVLQSTSDELLESLVDITPKPYQPFSEAVERLAAAGVLCVTCDAALAKNSFIFRTQDAITPGGLPQLMLYAYEVGRYENWTMRTLSNYLE